MVATTGDPRLLREALAQHYAQHGLPADGGAREPYWHLRMGGLSIPIPNPPARQRVLFYHDANHVLTGYNTVFTEGEMSIAAFELGNGCGPYPVAWLSNFGAFAAGLVMRPRVMFGTFVRGRRAGCIYTRPEPREALAGMTVDALRALLGLDSRDTTPTAGDVLRFAGWSILGAAALAFPPATVWLILT